jgi:hypothetical protein
MPRIRKIRIEITAPFAEEFFDFFSQLCWNYDHKIKRFTLNEIKINPQIPDLDLFFLKTFNPQRPDINFAILNNKEFPLDLTPPMHQITESSFASGITVAGTSTSNLRSILKKSKAATSKTSERVRFSDLPQVKVFSPEQELDNLASSSMETGLLKRDISEVVDDEDSSISKRPREEASSSESAETAKTLLMLKNSDFGQNEKILIEFNYAVCLEKYAKVKELLLVHGTMIVDKLKETTNHIQDISDALKALDDNSESYQLFQNLISKREEQKAMDVTTKYSV